MMVDVLKSTVTVEGVSYEAIASLNN